MTLFKFHDDDIFINTVEGYPEFRILIHSGAVVIDDVPDQSGSHLSNILDVSDGYISLYERNIDKVPGQKQYAYITKDSSRQSFKIYSNAEHNVYFNYDGEHITSSYNHSASISRYYFPYNCARMRLRALRNALDRNKFFSPHYAFNGSFGNKATQIVNLVSIPSILYGQKIKKGTVSLRYYVGGELVGQLKDNNYKGELVQVGPKGSTGSGSVAGVVLYEEGMIALTGSWSLDSAAIDYLGDGDANKNSKWIYFAAGGNDGLTINPTFLSSSFAIDYQGITQVQTMTMMAHAKYGELNHSNNPTYLTTTHSSMAMVKTGSYNYTEVDTPVKNIVDTKLTDHTPAFDKETYISKVVLYDKKKNIIGIAKVAVPVRKTEDRQYTFKLKLDI